jgi:hypothetical protein
MDAGIADTINRRDVTIMCARLDAMDLPKYRLPTVLPWYRWAEADALMSTDDRTRADRAWIVGRFASQTPGLTFDGAPADCDWDNLFQHFRDAIRARRDPKTPPAGAAQIQPSGVV